MLGPFAPGDEAAAPLQLATLQRPGQVGAWLLARHRGAEGAC